MDDTKQSSSTSRPYPLLNKKPLISCHHGNVTQPNNIAAARQIIEKYQDIDIVEIDFIVVDKHVVSSHDYDANSLLKGSPLHEWIDYIIIERNLILWIDLKVRLDVMAYIYDYSVYTASFFMNTLNDIRSYYLENKGIDIMQYTMITCQDKDTRWQLEQKLHTPTTHEGGIQWLLVYDIPFNTSYIVQYLTPKELQYLVNNYVYNRFMCYDFSASPIISLDLSFFDNDLDKMARFIYENTTIQHGTMIVIYNFPLTQKRLTLENYHIIMQYDYPS